MKNTTSGMRAAATAALLGIGIGIGIGIAQPASAGVVNVGDVFASTGNGTVQHRDGTTGALIETYNTGRGGFTTGSLYQNGFLYVTNFSDSTVSKINTTTGVPSLFISSGLSTPESIVADASNHLYVGNTGNGAINEYTLAGALIGTSTAASARVDWMDLAADQKTMYYTTEGNFIGRVDVSTHTNLSNFTSGITGGGNAFAFRILGDGGVLLADGVDVKRFNSAGALIQTYGSTLGGQLFALNLNPDGTTFITGDDASGNYYKFNIATGALLQTVATGAGGELFGLSVAGEMTVATTPEPATLVLSGLGVLGVLALDKARRRARRAVVS